MRSTKEEDLRFNLNYYTLDLEDSKWSFLIQLSTKLVTRMWGVFGTRKPRTD
jgi:hypothetical protein